VSRRLFFDTQQRIASPESSSNIKKSAVPRGEDIRKKKGEKSSNFGEIIKKLYFLVWCKARQRATHATPHPSVIAHFTCGELASATSTPGGGGEGGRAG
jgi:hypothetical protein